MWHKGNIMADLSIFKLDSQTITIKDTTARQAAESAKTLATTASGNATTALNKVNDLANKLYPVGSIYMSVNATNPAELFGGTWEQIKGRFLIGVGPNDANTTDWWGSEPEGSVNCPAGELGGESLHTLTVDETPSHRHEMAPWVWAVSAGFNTGTNNVPVADNGNAGPYNSVKSRQKQYSEITGGGLAHNNMPPYLAVYMWKRIA